MGKNLPAMQEMKVQSLGQKDPLEKEMATHSSALACRIPQTEEPGGLQSQRVGHHWATAHKLCSHLGLVWTLTVFADQVTKHLILSFFLCKLRVKHICDKVVVKTSWDDVQGAPLTPRVALVWCISSAMPMTYVIVQPDSQGRKLRAGIEEFSSNS